MSISKAEHDELCCVYAGLLLFDDKSEITAEKIEKIITASGNKVDAYYPEFFAKYLAGMNLESFLNNIGSAAPSGAPVSTNAAAKGDNKKPDPKAADKGKDAKKKEEKKEVKKEEEEEEGFMEMFG